MDATASPAASTAKSPSESSLSKPRRTDRLTASSAIHCQTDRPLGRSGSSTRSRLHPASSKIPSKAAPKAGPLTLGPSASGRAAARTPRRRGRSGLDPSAAQPRTHPLRMARPQSERPCGFQQVGRLRQCSSCAPYSERLWRREGAWRSASPSRGDLSQPAAAWRRGESTAGRPGRWGPHTPGAGAGRRPVPPNGRRRSSRTACPDRRSALFPPC